MDLNSSSKLPKVKMPGWESLQQEVNWEKKYQELLEWVDRGESNLIEWIKDEEPETEAGDVHLILDYGRKRKKKGKKNSLWESSERRKAKSKPDCLIRIEYRVPKDVATLESEGFEKEDIESYPRRCNLRPRVISWMKDKGHDGPILKLVHTVEKKSGVKIPSQRKETSPNPTISEYPVAMEQLQKSSPPPNTLAAILDMHDTPPVSAFRLKEVKPNCGSHKGGELIKLFGCNLNSQMKVMWGKSTVEFVCKSDSEIWFTSLPGSPGTSVSIKVEHPQESLYQLLSFNYNHPVPLTLETKINKLDSSLKAASKLMEENVLSFQSVELRSVFSNLKILLQECNKCTEEVSLELKSQKKGSSMETEVETHAAYSLAFLAESPQNENNPNAKRFKRDTPSVNITTNDRTKLFCGQCHALVIRDCAEELEFVRSLNGLALKIRNQAPMDAVYFTPNNGTQSVKAVLHCKSCHIELGDVETRLHPLPTVYLQCSHLLFQKGNSQPFGDVVFENIKSKLTEIPVAEMEGNPKTLLLEYCQNNKLPLPRYSSHHSPDLLQFDSSVEIGNLIFNSSGHFQRKYDSEKSAAAVALHHLRTQSIFSKPQIL